MRGFGFITGGFIFGVFLAFIAAWVFTAMIRWRIFVKAGQEGWKSLIPIYGDYVEYTIVWDGKWFWIDLAAVVGASLLFMIPIIGPTIAVAGIIVAMVISVVFAMQKAHAFGKDDGFAVGLMVFEFVFNILLAFNDDIVYQGPQPTPGFFSKLRNSDLKQMYAQDMHQGAPQGQPGAYAGAPYGQPQPAQPAQPVYGQPAPEAPAAEQPAPETAPAAEQPAQPQPEAPAQPSVKICPKCGAVCGGSDRFCSECGSPLE